MPHVDGIDYGVGYGVSGNSPVAMVYMAPARAWMAMVSTARARVYAGNGVFGKSPGNGNGVYGICDDCCGVYGVNGNGTGLYGESGMYVCCHSKRESENNL